MQSLCQLVPPGDIPFFINDLGMHAAGMPVMTRQAASR